MMIRPERIMPPTRLSYGRMRMLLYDLAPQLTVSSALLPDGLCGCYDDESQTILIDRRLTYTAKKCTLVHELVHWRRGDHDCGSVGESRTRRETARRLISLFEYATVENIWEGDAFRMADELDVTPQVLEDYRAMLSDSIQKHREG